MVYVEVWTVLERRLFPFAFPLGISLCSLGGIAELQRFTRYFAYAAEVHLGM